MSPNNDSSSYRADMVSRIYGLFLQCLAAVALEVEWTPAQKVMARKTMTTIQYLCCMVRVTAAMAA